MKIIDILENWKESSVIVINGVPRPTTNSTGAPIAATRQGIVNFYKWFNNSVCVDAEGRPLVMYHGTKAPQQPKEFKPMVQMQRKLKIQPAPKSLTDLSNARPARGTRYNTSTGAGVQAGMFFSNKKNYAAMYGSDVGEYYLKIERPFVSKATPNSGDHLQIITKGDVDILKNELHKDGVTSKGMSEYIVFDANQIKRVDNPGKFSPVSKLSHR